LKDAKLSSGELDEIVMVGGSTRIPAVLELVKRTLVKIRTKRSTLTRWWLLVLRFRGAFLPER